MITSTADKLFFSLSFHLSQNRRKIKTILCVQRSTQTRTESSSRKKRELRHREQILLPAKKKMKSLILHQRNITLQLPFFFYLKLPLMMKPAGNLRNPKEWGKSFNFRAQLRLFERVIIGPTNI